MSKLSSRPSARTLDTIRFYRSTFGRDEQSRITLIWLLERCGLFRKIEREDQRVLHNFGIELLENMGLLEGLNHRLFVDAVLRFSIPKEAIDSRKE